MSKGSKRKGGKAVERDYKAAFPQSKHPPTRIYTWAHLTMSDEEIERTFWNCGKADRTRMKKQAANERLRISVAAILKEEKETK